MLPAAIQAHIDALEEAFRRRSWHGTNLLGSIRGLTPAAAAWRPAPGRHNIWELVVHAAYWKYTVTRRLSGRPRGSFPLPGSDWFHRPEKATSGALGEDVALLKACHEDLLNAVRAVRLGELGRRPPGTSQTRAFMIRGVAAHDLYHTGQIQLLKRLRP